MNTSQLALAADLAKTTTPEMLYHALAIMAVRDAQDMLSDMMKDPEWIRADGMPTRKSFMAAAVNFMHETQPIVVGDEVDMPPDEAKRPTETPFEYVCRAAVARVLRQYPEFCKITVVL
jgi:hypothetical protein